MAENFSEQFLALVQTIAQLRNPQKGCPWDLKQTHASLKPFLIEESYEALEAIDSNNPKNLYDELGDVLLQVLLHAQIAQDAGQFDIGTVMQNLNEKMIRRHPHVFGETQVSGTEEVLKNWDAIKKTEKAKPQSILDGIPTSLPALLRAEKISKRAVKVGFDWDKPQDVINKIKEELAELEEALQEKDFRHAEEEAGDFLFTIVNLLRQLKLAPEESLQTANNKFVKRFQSMEQMIKTDGLEPEKLNLQEWETYWQRAKKNRL